MLMTGRADPARLRTSTASFAGTSESNPKVLKTERTQGPRNPWRFALWTEAAGVAGHARRFSSASAGARTRARKAPV